MNQQYATDSYIVNPNDFDPPESPPEDVYTLRFEGIESIGLGKPFKEGDEPKVQMVLNFKIDAPPGSPQEDWGDFDVRGWFSPILHYGPNLPDWSGNRYTEPNLYKLVRAINGGAPLPLPVERDENGRSFYPAYDAAQLLQQFVGQRFRSVIKANANGWPRLNGDPIPMPQSGKGRRGQQAQQTLAEAAPANGAEGGADPFEGAEVVL